MIEIALIENIRQRWRRLLSTAVTFDSEVADDSILGQIAAVSDVSDYDREKHSLEALATMSRDDIIHDDASDSGYLDPYITTGSFGAWQEIISSLSADRYLSGVLVRCPSIASDQTVVVEIGIGAASSETTIIRTSFFRLSGLYDYIRIPMLPRRLIASGTRISVRGATSGTGGTHYIDLMFSDIP